MTFQQAQAQLDAGSPWQASHLFERAIHEGFSKASGYRALAEAYLALNNRLFDARKALERSLAADSTDAATWYRLAEVNLRLEGMDAENRARRALREVLRLDPEYPGAFDRWHRLYLDREDARELSEILGSHLDENYQPDIALRRIAVLHDVGAYEEALRELERFERQLGKDGEHAAAWSYYMGVTLAALGRDAEGWQHYLRGIQAARGVADLDPYFADIEPLLPEDDRRAWPDWSPSKDREYLMGWWNQRDPLPLSDVNERWIEQQRRIRHARETFQYRKPISIERLTSLKGNGTGLPTLAIRLDERPMDDRTEIYLRHGEPDMKDGVGDDECGFWYYHRQRLPEGKSFAVNFRRGADFDSLGQFFGNDCIYSELPTTDMGRARFAPGGIEYWDRPRIMEETAAQLAVALGSDSYPYEITKRIPIAVAPANFSYLPGTTDLTIYFSVPTRTITAGTEGARYRKGLILYDHDWNEVARRTEEVAYTLGSQDEAKRGETFLVDLFRLQIPPGDYHVAIQLDDRNGEGIGVWEGPVTVRGFASGRLELSDVVLAGNVESGEPGHFTRHGRKVLPLPSRTLLRGQTFFLYYEIYDLLAGPDRRSRFRVEYAIRSERLDRGAVRRLFKGLAGLVGVREEPEAIVLAFEREEKVDGGLWSEALSIDTGELAPGTYRVDVTVIDQLAGNAETRQAVDFTIIE